MNAPAADVKPIPKTLPPDPPAGYKNNEWRQSLPAGGIERVLALRFTFSQQIIIRDLIRKAMAYERGRCAGVAEPYSPEAAQAIRARTKQKVD